MTTTPDLSSYDIILVNTSGGKDSQTMLGRIYDLAAAAGLTDRLVAVHADLGRVEWPGTASLAERQCQHYGIRFEKISRPQGDLLDHIEARGMFPSSTTRYCTSDHKRGQVAVVMTRLVRELALNRPVRILNCMGFRSEESPARAKKPVFAHDKRASTKTTRSVDNWLPIFELTLEQVWADIEARGVEHHPAYDAGMPRLSCCFCVLASKGALVRAAQLAPELAQTYLSVEVRIGHRFTDKLSMAEIIQEAEATTVTTVDDWAA